MQFDPVPVPGTAGTRPSYLCYLKILSTVGIFALLQASQPGNFLLKCDLHCKAVRFFWFRFLQGEDDEYHDK
jgi:hypothetical protein